MLYFKDINSIKRASFDELLKVPSMDKKSSNSILEFFKSNK